MVHKQILSPEEPKPKVPVSKTALLVLILLVVVGGLVATLLSRTSHDEPKQPEASTETPLVGKAASIADEEERAKAAAPKASEPAKATGGQPDATQTSGTTSLPSARPGVGVVPPGMRRSDNSAVLLRDPTKVGKGLSADEPTSTADVEAEALIRGSKSVVIDEGESTAFANPQQRRDTGAGSNPVPLSAPGASSATDGRISNLERIAAQYASGQGGTGTAGKAWLKEYATGSNGTHKVLTPYETSGQLTLHQGKLIPAVLGRMVNSDLPGRITAYTTIDVYDSLGQGKLLIPKGSMLVGQYDSGIKVGQERLLFAFERLIMPNGQSFDLPAANGTDMRGSAGMSGDVNNHFLKMFASSLFIAVVADKTTNSGNTTNIGTTGITNAAGQVLSDTSKTILQRNTTIQPTITLEQGSRINVEVVADMVFPSAYSKN